MAQKLANIFILIDGMTCVSCENRIESALRKTQGIEDVKVNYTTSRAMLTYDANVISLESIENIIESLDYKVKKEISSDKRAIKTQKIPVQKTSINQVIGIGIILSALFIVFRQFGALNIFNAFPQAEQGMGYGLLFIIGILTSIHCVAMCGGINISQCVPHMDNPANGNKLASLKPSILYNAGRVISYTVIGGIVGGLGSVVSFSGWAKGLVAIVAGIFMVIMGLNMLNIFPWLRKFSPRLPKIFAGKINAEKHGNNKSPLYIGLLNGLMPCGPLQAMQLYALSTGSPIKGALSMLLFSLGTVPLMFGLGALSSLLSKRFTKKMMQVSAVLVVILGVFMFQNGIGLSGLSLPSFSGILSNATSTPQVAGQQAAGQTETKVQNGVQMVTSKLTSGSYEPITVKAGTPVKWTIQAAPGTINGCNNRLLIPEYKVDKKLTVGDNVIEFTPTKSGTVPFSCWMGMIRSKITIIPDTAGTTATTTSGNVKTQYNEPSIAAIPGSQGVGGCCSVAADGLSTTNQAAIQLAEIVNGKQQAKITVDGYGYSPQILVIQRGLVTSITFDIKQATGCSGVVYIPEFGFQLDLAVDGSVPEFTAGDDFTISCWMNMLGMNVKVVDDLKQVDLNSIQDEVANTPQLTGGGCCG